MAFSQELFVTKSPISQVSEVIVYLTLISVVYVSLFLGSQMDTKCFIPIEPQKSWNSVALAVRMLTHSFCCLE
jgi:hypothetical protein